MPSGQQTEWLYSVALGTDTGADSTNTGSYVSHCYQLSVNWTLRDPSAAQNAFELDLRNYITSASRAALTCSVPSTVLVALQPKRVSQAASSTE